MPRSSERVIQRAKSKYPLRSSFLLFILMGLMVCFLIDTCEDLFNLYLYNGIILGLKIHIFLRGLIQLCMNYSEY